MITADQAATFSRCMTVGGVAVFPADTVYGLACEPDDPAAVRRLYALKGRPPDKPAAIMFFDVELALEALGELGTETRGAMARLLPGGVTLLVPNPLSRFPLAGTGGPEGALGIRVPALTAATAALIDVRWPILQSSANHAGGPDARRLADVPADIRAEADLLLDAGDLPGTPSTVVDLRSYETDRTWRIVRSGAVADDAIAAALG